MLIGAVIIALIVFPLIGLVIFVARAGRNSERVRETAAVERKLHNMAVAETNKPSSKEELLSRLTGGTAVMLLFLLNGCQGCSHSLNCPTLVEYSLNEQKAVAEELSEHNLPHTTRWLSDYVGLRDQVKACQK